MRTGKEGGEGNCGQLQEASSQSELNDTQPVLSPVHVKLWLSGERPPLKFIENPENLLFAPIVLTSYSKSKCLKPQNKNPSE